MCATVTAFVFDCLQNAEDVFAVLRQHGVSVNVGRAHPVIDDDGFAFSTCATEDQAKLLATNVKCFGDSAALRLLQDKLPWACVCSVDEFWTWSDRARLHRHFPRDRCIFKTDCPKT